MTDQIEFELAVNAGAFYKAISRRPLIDIIPEDGEAATCEKNFSNANNLTLWSWREIWKKNTKENLEYFKYFNRDHSAKVFANECINEPIILVGAGPSLEKNMSSLKLAK